MRERARAARGVKVEDVKRGRKFQRVNVVAAQFEDETGRIHRVAPLCYSQHTNSEIFEYWFKTNLVKSVARGSTIIMDRASFHRPTQLKNLARRRGVKILFLPAYSPDLNPIEKTWANMKKALADIISKEESLECSIMQYFNNVSVC